MVLLTTGAIVAFEAGLTFLANAGVRVQLLRVIAIVAATGSILAGSLLGFTGEHDAFASENPKLYKRLEGYFK
jgi:hypothetical protein